MRCILIVQPVDRLNMRVSLERVVGVSNICVNGVEITHMNVRIFILMNMMSKEI